MSVTAFRDLPLAAATAPRLVRQGQKGQLRSGRARHRACRHRESHCGRPQENAGIPVMSRPTMRVCMVSVPSKV